MVVSTLWLQVQYGIKYSTVQCGCKYTMDESIVHLQVQYCRKDSMVACIVCNIKKNVSFHQRQENTQAFEPGSQSRGQNS